MFQLGRSQLGETTVSQVKQCQRVIDRSDISATLEEKRGHVADSQQSDPSSIGCYEATDLYTLLRSQITIGIHP